MCTSAVVRVFRFVTVLLTALFATAQAGTVYVSTAGNDGSDGLSWATAKKTVQAGLNAAQAGDQVWVAAGTYVENITLALGVDLCGGFAGTETTLGERNWVTNHTILDGNRAGSVVTAPSGATASTGIDGFTITNGSGTMFESYLFGSGLYLSYSSPTITNNTITGNTASSGIGGGLYLDNSSPTITNNTITGNSAVSGGGLGLDYNCSAVITNNTITNNTASSGVGGGLCVWESSPTLANNTITGNRAAAGAGIHCHGFSPTIMNNTITGNSTAGSGGGIDCAAFCTPIIMSNTIARNSASRGGGIRCDSSTPTIADNMIVENSAVGDEYGYGLGGGVYCDGTKVCAITNNRIYRNTAYRGGGMCLDSPGTVSGNLIASNIALEGAGVRCGFLRTVTIANNTIVRNSSTGEQHPSVGIDCSYAYATIINNIVAFHELGIYCTYGADDITLRNNCAYGNSLFDYSLVGHYEFVDPTGTNGNISVDPSLVRLPSSGADGTWGTADDDYGDLHLLTGSPCINAGDPAYVPAADETDMDGQARKICSRVDIGADEFCLVGDGNFDGYVNVRDLQVLVAAWGTQRGEAGYSPAVDFNGDGTVNVADLALLVGNWGKTIVDDYAQAGVRWLANNATQPGVVVAASGLQYKILTQGTGPVPTAVDTVTVNYAGSLINGNVFDNHDGIQFRVDQLIAGWVEALQLMPVGSRWMLYIPANLGYGNVPIGSIPPNSVLVFDVTLVSIP